MTPIRAVLFDYGMVLSGPPHPPARARMEQLLDASAESFHEAYWQHRDAYDRGTLPGERYWQAVAASLRKTLEAPTLAALLAADTALWTQPNQPMIDWAHDLQQAGIPTGILSNLGDAMELGIVQKFPWLHNFAHHTFSHRLGIAKPDLAIYRYAAEGLRTPPAHILFIDDRDDNICAAREASMQAIQYSTQARFLADLQAFDTRNLSFPRG